MSDDVIELNGKRYDAITGALLGKSVTRPIPAPQPVHGRVIDGFVRPLHPSAHKIKTRPPVAPVKKAAPAAHHPKPVRAVAGKAAEPALHHTAHTSAHRTQRVHHAAPKIKPHQPEHAKTLMRRAVHKPETHLKPAIKTQAPAEMMAKPASSLLQRKHAVSHIDPTRKARAERVARHQAVRRFHSAHAGVSNITAPHISTATHIPVIAVKPAPAPQTHTIQPVTRQQQQTHTDIFEAAIARANSHQHATRAKHRRGHKRLINTLAAVGAFLIIGGFVTYLNMPAIQMHVASIQVGFHAAMPSYAPTGYALEGGVQRSGGTISLSYRSGDSHYVLTQQASDWNSQTLLDNTLALSGPHDTIQRNGQTIYVYGNGANASWVNAGIRYDVMGNAQLNNDEIAAIATSL